MDSGPMDIDPVDDGPREVSRGIVPMSPAAMAPPPADASGPANEISKEEEARQAIEMLRGDDVSQRVAAACRLQAVASVLGPERTREELIPFITDGIDDEDEVLLALASSLGKMSGEVGGVGHAHTLLVPLELLLTVEENTVRDAASASAQNISEVLPQASFQSRYAKMLERLATNQWFTARMSSASLISSAYPKLNTEQQEEHLNFFAKLCQDETPMVRRVAAKYLGKMLEHVVAAQGRESLAEGAVVPTVILPLYEELASSDQPDSVRLQTTENCVSFGRVMSDLANAGELRESELALIRRLLSLIVATIDDRPWRVRWTAAAKFADVVRAYNALPNVMDSLIPSYEKLLQDPEAEVRTAATFNLAHVAKGCMAMVPLPPPGGRQPTEVELLNYQGPRVTAAERLVKRVTSLTEDDSEHVRAALAMVATELAPILGRDATINHLVPPVLLLLRDAASEVRLNLISSLESLNEVIGVDLLSQSLLPAILDLAQDGKWRIRLAIIQHIPLLASQLGIDFFTERLSAICVGWLGDNIATIRMAAAGVLKDLTALFGSDWACQHLMPSIEEISRHPSYLRRLTAVQACARMATEMDPEVATMEVLPMILEMATDKVANIRFNVAKALETIAKVCGPAMFKQQVRPVLSLLLDDSDSDVRFYAEKTMASIEESVANAGNL